LRAHIHEIIIHGLTAKGEQFQRFIGAGRRQDGIGGSDGWDDILDDTQCLEVGDAFDAVKLSAS
jgi:hypothetical protein